MKTTTKVVLVNTPMDTNIGHIPYGMAYISSYLKAYTDFPLEVKKIDARLWKKSACEITEEILKEEPDIVGMTCLSIQVDEVYEITGILKQKKPDITIVHGGPHITALPESSLEKGCDYCVTGEGEQTFYELINCLVKNGNPAEINGLVFKSNGAIIKTPQRELIKDLDECPMPDYSDFDLSEYKETIHVTDDRCAFVFFSRGCAFDCIFCCSNLIWRRKVRCRSVENMMTEFETLHQKYGYTHFHFFDDDFLAVPQKVIPLVEALMKRNAGWKWVIQSRCGSIIKNKELLPLLKKAGCMGVELGIESVDAKVLLYLDKRQTVDEVFETFRLLLDADLVPLPLMMSCSVGETLETYYITNIELSKLPTHKNMSWCESFTTPFPGARLYDKLEEYGVLINRKWSEFHPNKINFIPHSLLNDIPLKNTEAVDDDVYNLVRKFVMQIGITSLDREKLNGIFNLCSGSLSVGEILEEFFNENSSALDKLTAIRLCLRSIIVMAWIGVIKSANTKVTVEPQKHLWLDHFDSQDFTWGV